MDVERQAHSPVEILVPYGGVATPPQYSSNSRAKVGPNSYARGDCTRPCYARRRSLKREPAYRKTKHIPERVFPTRAGDTATQKPSGFSGLRGFSHTQGMPHMEQKQNRSSLHTGEYRAVGLH